MRKIYYTLLALYVVALFVAFFTLYTREDRREMEAERVAYTEAQCDSAVVTSVRMHSMLYTAEAKSQKTMKYSSKNKMSFSFMGVSKDVNIPFSKTEATIPVTMAYKVGINLEKVEKGNINIMRYPENGKGGAISIVLPDPVIVPTSVVVDHDSEKMEKQFLSKGLTYDQYQKLLHQAKEEAWNELTPEELRSLTETAKVSATDILLPQLRALGFDTVEISYRQGMDASKIERIRN